MEDRPGERLQRYHELVCSDLGRLGGTVVKFVGDAVMVLPLVGNERRQPTKMYVRHPNCRTRIAPRKGDWATSHWDCEPAIGPADPPVSA